ncbi:MAG: ComEC/Rec2 family competence protein, partial [Robiginitomaculum sp.]
TESLRGAGLAHVLAISGLHMGLMAGGAFWLVAFVLAAIEPIGRSIDVRKPAALIGIIAATFYLALSGASVSTQRAFIMAVVMFSAVFLSRPAISMRSIAVAAALTLLLHPESLISAGFQMSFAAAGALVAVYGSLRQNFPAQYTPGLFRRGLNGFAALSITSAVAGTATGGFAAIHFHRVARYGFAANIIAMPIFTFVVMPMGLAAFIAMPFGLESIPLAIMSKGLVFMLAITDKFSQMEQSQWLFSAGPKYAAALYGAGFVLLCLGPLKKRLIGLGAIAVLTVMWMGVSQPDMRISEGADLAFWEVTEGGRILYVERKRADNYGREQFIERAGTPDADLMTYKQERADCDARACRIAFKGRTIAIATSPQIAAQECANADIVLLTERQAGPVTRRNCQALLLDAKSLERDGAQNLYFTDEGIKSVPANPPARRNRPWGQKRRR